MLPANYSRENGLSAQFITYEKHIQPIIQKKCISCHSGGNTSTNVDLSPGKGFNTLLQFVNYKEALAIKSALIEILYGKEFMAPQKKLDNVPHPSGDPLTEEELLTFIRWIDLGAIQKVEKQVQ